VSTTVQSNDVRNVSLEAFIARGALIVDVREEGEFNAEHHPAAINIPAGEAEERIGEFGKGPVILYCISGARSRPVEHMLRDRGIEVLNAGGIWDVPGYSPRMPRPSCGA
jgi:phage shock protein E